jgi:hypothetical protein
LRGFSDFEHLDQDRGRLVSPKADALVFDGEDAGRAGADDSDHGPFTQPHFGEPGDERALAADFVNAAFLACAKQFQRQDLGHDTNPGGNLAAMLRLSLKSG